MTKIMFEYTKSVLERVSFDVVLFSKGLEKAIRTLLPFELEQLKEWLSDLIIEKPELKSCMVIIHSDNFINI